MIMIRWWSCSKFNRQWQMHGRPSSFQVSISATALNIFHLSRHRETGFARVWRENNKAVT